MNQTYIMSGIKSDFTTKYSPPISLDDSEQYEAALLSIDLFNSIPNITSLNNVVKYSKDGGNTWVDIMLDTGSYELSASTAQSNVCHRVHPGRAISFL